ncbi:hypothetical protein [Candidatus Lokiarchaeum ossiferum]|uniref:hypothetical protein n=1 Tax=Candidatus Lokiarchaeum ossiferum TaxID=2951803 RepID=UPI00352F5823
MTKKATPQSSIQYISKKLLKDLGFKNKDNLPADYSGCYTCHDDWWVFTAENPTYDNFVTVYSVSGSKKLRVLYEKVIFFFDKKGDRKPHLEMRLSDPKDFALSISSKTYWLGYLGFVPENKISDSSSEVHIKGNFEKGDFVSIRHCGKELFFEFYPNLIN